MMMRGGGACDAVLPLEAGSVMVAVGRLRRRADEETVLCPELRTCAGLQEQRTIRRIAVT